MAVAHQSGVDAVGIARPGQRRRQVAHLVATFSAVPGGSSLLANYR
jgi:hypothetical protein